MIVMTGARVRQQPLVIMPQPHSIQKAVNETLLCHPVAAGADNSDAFYRTQVLYELDCDDRKAAASGGILFRTRFGR